MLLAFCIAFLFVLATSFKLTTAVLVACSLSPGEAGVNCKLEWAVLEAHFGCFVRKVNIIWIDPFHALHNRLLIFCLFCNQHLTHPCCYLGFQVHTCPVDQDPSPSFQSQCQCTLRTMPLLSGF